VKILIISGAEETKNHRVAILPDAISRIIGTGPRFSIIMKDGGAIDFNSTTGLGVDDVITAWQAALGAP
jgi:hypothetical protein